MTIVDSLFFYLFSTYFPKIKANIFNIITVIFYLSALDIRFIFFFFIKLICHSARIMALDFESIFGNKNLLKVFF
jgi:hypothetical protein